MATQNTTSVQRVAHIPFGGAWYLERDPGASRQTLLLDRDTFTAEDASLLRRFVAEHADFVTELGLVPHT